jgi:hypothetical protein
MMVMLHTATASVGMRGTPCPAMTMLRPRHVSRERDGQSRQGKTRQFELKTHDRTPH